MPYLAEKVREELTRGRRPTTVGELNFILTWQLESYWFQRGESYQTYNDLLGAIEGAKLELYRTLIGPYESSKALMNGALASQPDIAWAAGFFDGEGNVNHTLQRDRKGNIRSKGRAQITVVQKSPLLLLRFKGSVGGIGYIRPPSGTTTCWHYTVAAFDDVLHVVICLWPYLGPIKREQALSVLRKWEKARDLDLGLPAGPLSGWPQDEAGS
jgi:hypothetical protein